MPLNISDRAQIDVEFRDEDVARGTRRVERNLNEMGRSAQRTSGVYASAMRRVNNETQGVTRSTHLLHSAVIALGGAAALTSLATLTDSYTNLHNRLRVVTTSTGQLADVSDRLFEVSNNTRVSWEATTQIFQRTAQASKELGVSYRELLDFTESLNQAVIISGATAQEAGNALIQLSQGLASATLRGDELRSVMEQLPFVARVIAEHLGVGIGQFRELAHQGRISAQVILEAFREARDSIEQRFLRLTPTISQSFAVLQNHLLQYVGEVNKATGATGILSQAIFGLANNLDTVASSLQAVAIFILTVLVARAIPALIAGLNTLALTMRAHPLLTLATVIAGITSALIGFRNQITLTHDGVVTLADLFGGLAESIREATSATRELGGDESQAAIDRSIDRWELFKEGVAASVVSITNDIDRYVRSILFLNDALNVIQDNGGLFLLASPSLRARAGRQIDALREQYFNRPSPEDRARRLAEERARAAAEEEEEEEDRRQAAVSDPLARFLGLDPGDTLGARGRVTLPGPDLALDDTERQLEEFINLYNDVESDITNIRIRASRDRAEAIAFERDALVLLAESLDFPPELIAQLKQDYERIIQDVRQEEIIQPIRLVFGSGDVQSLESAADVAAYSVGLMVREIESISPAAATAIRIVEQVATGLTLLQEKGGGFAGAASLAGAAVGVASVAFRLFRSRAERAAEETERLNEALRESAERTGEYSRRLQEFGTDDLAGRFQTQTILLSRISRGVLKFVNDTTLSINETAARAYVNQSTLDRDERTRAHTHINRLQEIEELAGRIRGGAANNLSEAFQDYQHYLRLERRTGEERLELFRQTVGRFVDLENIGAADVGLAQQRRIREEIADINRQIADAELEARRAEAERLIEEIERQHRAVLDAINDREEAARAAALRAVGAQFDLAEASLRASYLPQLRGAAGDPAATALILERVSGQIEDLRERETEAGAQALGAVRERFDEARAQAEVIRDGLVGAVEAAVEDLSQPFGEALAQNLAEFFGTLGFDTFTAAAQNLQQLFEGGDIIDAELFGNIVATAYAPTLTKIEELVDVDQQILTALTGPDALARVRGLSGHEFAVQAFEEGGFQGLLDAVQSLTPEELAYFESQQAAERAQAERDTAIRQAIDDPSWVRNFKQEVFVTFKVEANPTVNIDANVNTGTTEGRVRDIVKDETEKTLVNVLTDNTEGQRAVIDLIEHSTNLDIPEEDVTFGG